MRGFFGGEQQPRPKLCPVCGALVGINATRCHECGANLRFSLAALGKKLSGVFGDNEAPITTALLIANISMLDRKSTRLNSSHEWISYAVFCLKKKKRKKINTKNS